MTLIRNIAIVGALCLTLTACQEPTLKPETEEPETVIFRVDETPHAQLSGNVIPQAYRLNMRMDPDDDGFSGLVEIDIDIQKPTNKIWMHGKHMTVSSAMALIDGTEIPLNFTEMPHQSAPSGIANLSSCLLYTSPSPRDRG